MSPIGLLAIGSASCSGDTTSGGSGNSERCSASTCATPSGRLRTRFAPNPIGRPPPIPASSSITQRRRSLGGSDAGEPGFRTDNYYGCYFRDLDGNKLNFFCIKRG